MTPAAAQTSTDPATVARAFADTFTRNDPAAALAMVTNDVVFLGGPCGSAPGGLCVGKDQFQQAVASGPAQVRLTSATASGNVVHIRSEERFPFPPQASAAGVQRVVEVGDLVVTPDGHIARGALVSDVTDAQTVSLLRVFATLGPPPGAQGTDLVAQDGQSLATQPIAAQLQFLTVWGNQAAAEWARQHNAALATTGH